MNQAENATIAGNATVAEMAAASLAAVRIFEKYGIDYCCGGKHPLSEVCAQKGLDVALVRQELEAAAEAQSREQRDWNGAPLAQLIEHIVAVHHGYLRRELPAIQTRMDTVYRVYNERYGASLIGLPEAFAGLRQELEPHLMKEEAILFPAIAAIASAAGTGSPSPRFPFGSIANPIRMMEHEHDGAGALLREIRGITDDFSVPSYGCATYKALMSGLAELETDLHMHIHLENNILFPRVIQLEAAA